MRVVFFLFLIGLFSCRPGDGSKASDEYYDLAETLKAQVLQLTERNAKLEKETRFNFSTDNDILYPDSAGWRRELNNVIGLDINRPVTSGRYEVVDGLTDKSSNLQIQHTFLKDSSGTGVTDMKVYYLADPSRVRRIEVRHKEKNPIYHSGLRVTLTFKDISGRPLLESYKMDGYQKMIFMDSSTYVVNGIISL